MKKSMSNTQWFITPRLIVDKSLYRGIGRPRKSDYRMYPDKDKDFYKVNPAKLVGYSYDDQKGWIYSEGTC